MAQHPIAKHAAHFLLATAVLSAAALAVEAASFSLRRVIRGVAGAGIAQAEAATPLVANYPHYLKCDHTSIAGYTQLLYLSGTGPTYVRYQYMFDAGGITRVDFNTTTKAAQTVYGEPAYAGGCNTNLNTTIAAGKAYGIDGAPWTTAVP